VLIFQRKGASPKEMKLMTKISNGKLEGNGSIFDLDAVGSSVEETTNVDLPREFDWTNSYPSTGPINSFPTVGADGE
jgi:hypothetical protein